MDVDLKDNVFYVNTVEQLLYDIMTEKNNFETIKKALNWQGFQGEVVIKRLRSKAEKVKEDIKKLHDLGISVEMETNKK